jgi:CubicO group peptidase (beta-lactamase class C family)
MKKIILMISLFSLIQPLKCFAQKNYSEIFDHYMEAQINVNEFSGAVLVAKSGNIIYQKTFGYADREWELLNNLDTKFEIGSLTKQFTAAAILHLVDQNKINLDDKLSKFFPDYPKGESVTIQMLLNHTSGIADYTALPVFNSIKTLPLKRDSVIALFKNQPYDFSPGTNCKYSNSGYFLLGCIIEKVTKQSYGNYVLEDVIKRASLQNTCVNSIDSILPLRAKGYSKSETGGWKNADYISMELAFSAGSIISTIGDLYKWQNSLLGGKIISKGMLTKMISPNQKGYGYGLRIDSLENHLRISHEGYIPGFASFLGYFPNDSVSIVVLSNDDGYAGPTANALASILFDLSVEMPSKAVERPINVAVLKNYIGKYQLGGTTNFELLVKDNKLYLKPEGQGGMELKPESETKFFFARDPQQEILFVTDLKGAIKNCYFINKGSRMEIKKLN